LRFKTSLPGYELGSGGVLFRRVKIVSGDDIRIIEKRWKERNWAVKRRLYGCCSNSEIVINPLPGYDQ
jgi:hypothetical protein